MIGDGGVYATVRAELLVQLRQPWSARERMEDLRDAAVRAARQVIHIQVQHQVGPDDIEAAYEAYCKAREAPVSDGGLPDIVAFRKAVLSLLPQANGAQLRLVSTRVEEIRMRGEWAQLRIYQRS